MTPAERERAKYQRRQAQGLCPRCGRNPGPGWCSECRSSNLRHTHRIRREQAANMLCSDGCGATAEGRCEACLEVRRIKAKVRREE